jgi:hypothetical protein
VGETTMKVRQKGSLLTRGGPSEALNAMENEKGSKSATRSFASSLPGDQKANHKAAGERPTKSFYDTSNWSSAGKASRQQKSIFSYLDDWSNALAPTWHVLAQPEDGDAKHTPTDSFQSKITKRNLAKRILQIAPPGNIKETTVCVPTVADLSLIFFFVQYFDLMWLVLDDVTDRVQVYTNKTRAQQKAARTSNQSMFLSDSDRETAPDLSIMILAGDGTWQWNKGSLEQTMEARGYTGTKREEDFREDLFRCVCEEEMILIIFMLLSSCHQESKLHLGQRHCRCNPVLQTEGKSSCACRKCKRIQVVSQFQG